MKRIYLQLTLLIWLIGGLCSITLASATNLPDRTPNAIGVGRTGADILPRDTFPKAVEKKPDLDKHVDIDGSKGQAESKVEAAEAHEAEEEDGGRDKDHPGEAAAFEKEITMDPATGTVPRIRLIKAMEATFNAKRSYPDVMGNRSALSWTERGPYTDVVGPSNGNTRANNAITAGRIRALMVDSADATKKTVWVGGVDGGLWKTTDITTSPANWVLVNDFLSNLAVTAICQDPTNYNTMYFCTGEAYFNADAVEGVGVFKSTDHGVTWTHLSSTANFKYCTRILCDYQGNVYLATRGNGLRRSTDGGSTWSADLTPTGLPSDICDLEISNTGVPGRLHLVTGIFTTQGYRYTDVPATVSSAVGWNSPATSFPTYSMRAEIAVSGNTLYAAPANAFYNVPTIYKSTDGGANWAAVGAQPASGGWASGQGWYNLSVAINPSNPNQCIVGGLDNYKTTDGGASWTKISSWVGLTGQYVHADQHNLAWLADGNTLIFACDGGIHYSSDGGTTIRDRNVGLRLKQFYSIAIHPTSTNYFLAGAQDNGTHKLTEPGLSSSVEVTGGDGAFVAIDQNEASYQFGAYIRSNYRRSVDGGATWTYHDFSNTGRFINPFDYDNAANKLYAAYDAGRYFRWNDPQTGSNSTIVSVPEFNSSQVSTVSVSPYTANRVYFGTGGGRIVKVDNADGATPTAVNLTQAGMPTSYVSCIATGTNDQNLMTVYSNYGVSNIWVSTNGGTSWTACEGNLPDMPVRWCLFYPGDNTKAYIATETGVWETTLLNGASTVWVANPTFPTVRATMLKYRDSDKTLVASTHGRGVWSAQIAPPCVAPTFTTCPTGPITQNTDLNQCTAVASYSVAAAGTPNPALTYTFSGATIKSSTSGTGNGETFNKGTTTVMVIATNECGADTCSFNVVVNDAEAPVITCANAVTVNNSPGLCSGTTILTLPDVTDNCTRTPDHALYFDGINDYCTSAATLTQNDNFTLEVRALYKGHLDYYQTLIGFNRKVEIMGYDGKIHYSVNNSSGFLVPEFNLVDGQWYHFALVRRLGVWEFYIDGVSYPIQQKPAPDLGGTFLIGGRTNTLERWKGALDEVRVWTVARTQAEIQTNMNSTLSAQTGLRLLYHADQGAAEGNNAGQATLLDFSGNGYHATLNNFALNGSTSNWVCGAYGGCITNNSPATYALGDNTVIWTTTDANGNSATCSQIVTVKDTEKPNALCKNISLNLGLTGTVNTNAAAINNGSADHCGSITLALNKTSFNCTNVGANTVTLSVTDNSNNTGTCTAIVTISYTSSPVAKCRNAIVALSSAGNGSITPAGINNGSTDLCASGLTFSLSKTTFNCSNVGANVVTLTVTNVAGNSSTCTGTVTVKDQTKPVAKCQAVTIDVQAGNTVTVPAAAVNNGSSDACTNPPSLSLLPNQFTCANVGPNTVTLTATDASNNKGTCTAIVTVTCSGGSINIQNGSAAAVANLSELMDLMPNPATDQVIVRLNDDALVDRRISVVDYTGKQVFSRVVPAGDRQLSIDLSASDFSTGVYMVSVQFKGSVQTKQLVVFR